MQFVTVCFVYYSYIHSTVFVLKEFYFFLSVPTRKCICTNKCRFHIAVGPVITSLVFLIAVCRNECSVEDVLYVLNSEYYWEEHRNAK